MKAYHIMIQVCNSSPSIWRKIEVSDELSFQQLHEAILTLFHWEQKKGTYFQIDNQTLYMDNKENSHASSLPLSTFFHDHISFSYMYGDQKEELWEISLFANRVMKEQASLQLLTYEQDHPIYGLGGVTLFQSIKKEVAKTNVDSSLHLFLKRLLHPLDNEEITNRFFDILAQNETLTNNIHKATFNEELLCCRTQLESHALISPNLMLIKMQKQTYPCYIECLDDGIEVMIFQDQSSFTRSIINSISDDPDLLFTNAITLDFLFEESDETDLYVNDKKTLCFVNHAGCLPSCPSDLDIIFLTTILKHVNRALQTCSLPHLDDNKMLVINEHMISECPYEIYEESFAVKLSDVEKQTLNNLPHTNEHISINFTAVPSEYCEVNKQLDIHLVARGNNFVKDERIQVDSMPVIIEQLYYYLDDLVHTRCIPESISTNSINLSHMLQQLCDDLHIELSLFTPSSQYKDDLLAILANTLSLTPEELLLMDEFEKDEDSQQLIFTEKYHIPTISSRKCYN